MKSRHLIIPDRLIPLELDLLDPEEKENYECHVNKYRFAALFCEGKTVLDLACGAGYGTEIIQAEGCAASVLGCDIDAKTIKHAQRHYAGDGISFICCGYDELRVREKFDVIVSINTLEYIRDPVHFLESMKLLLVDSGDFIVSTHITPTTDFNPHTKHDISYAAVIRLLNRSGFLVTKEYLQLKHFNAHQALHLIRNKNRVKKVSSTSRPLIDYYVKNPHKALKRARSLIFDRLCVKTLTLHARMISREHAGK